MIIEHVYDYSVDNPTTLITPLATNHPHVAHLFNAIV